ncbi:basic-leucine zipper transcription factor family protein [Striga asiatica]|uniref:Basic-leucine zipper transcription factor family protein n=1 Tax=Striga asiatica TaxID=4170 RepID=A0A5A7Q670_STRAF|nr:basic-leucine zipper transcription factor family protein [Striga asiatica]
MSVSPSPEKSWQTRASKAASVLPPGDRTTASWSPAARISGSATVSCVRRGNGLRVGTTAGDSTRPESDGRFDHVAPEDNVTAASFTMPVAIFSRDQNRRSNLQRTRVHMPAIASREISVLK